MSIENPFPFGYNLSELIKCLQRDPYRVYYGLKGTISIVLSEGYGKKHQQFRSLMKTVIAKEGYSVDNYQSLSLLTAAYAAETASILIKALKYFINEQKWEYDLIRLAMQQFNLLSIKHNGITGSLAINSDEKEIKSTFVIYNFIPLKDEGTLLVQPRAYIFYAKSAIHIQYIDGSGVNSTKSTIIYADGTTNPPRCTPERWLPTPFVGK